MTTNNPTKTKKHPVLFYDLLILRMYNFVLPRYGARHLHGPSLQQRLLVLSTPYSQELMRSSLPPVSYNL